MDFTKLRSGERFWTSAGHPGSLADSCMYLQAVNFARANPQTDASWICSFSGRGITRL